MIDSLDLVIAHQQADLVWADSLRAVDRRYYENVLQYDRESCARQLEDAKAAMPTTWDRLRDIITTAVAVFIGAAAVR